MDDDEMFDHLVGVGVIEVYGIAEDGEILYTYNFERMKVVYPEMYEDVMGGINSGLKALYEEGFINVEYDENLSATISATEKGIEFFNK